MAQTDPLPHLPLALARTAFSLAAWYKGRFRIDCVRARVRVSLRCIGLGRIFIYLFFTVIALLGSIGVTILVAKLWGRRLFSMVGPDARMACTVARPAVD